MNEKNILSLLNALGIDNGELHGDWVTASCPLGFAKHQSGKDSSPSFAILHDAKGRSGYNCFACNTKGRTLDLLWAEIVHYAKNHPKAPKMDLALAAKIIETENEIGYASTEYTGKTVDPERVFEEWPQWWLDTFPYAHAVDDARLYLASRNVSVALSKALDLRFDPKKRTVCFPIRNQNGDFCGMRGRFISPRGDFRHYDYRWNGESNNTSLVWLGEFQNGREIDFTRPVVVVEGQFDYAAVYRIYRNVLANLTSQLSTPKVRKLDNAVEVVDMFDNDLAGRTAGLTLTKRLTCLVRFFDYGTIRKMDPADMPTVELAERLSKYVTLDKPIE